MAKLTFFGMDDPEEQQRYIDSALRKYQTSDQKPKRFLLFFKRKQFVPTILEFWDDRALEMPPEERPAELLKRRVDITEAA